jgi:spermidine synthase
VIVTQASSPFFARKAFVCIYKTLRAAGFSLLAYHNHIPTMGEWGFVLGVEKELLNDTALKEAVVGLSFDQVPTRFLNQEAMISMAHFGKGIFDGSTEIEVNNESQPVLQEYYKQGRWEVY